jgi:hypothetical protein
MIYNEEHIFQLILEKLSGEISEENLQLLNKAAADDPAVQRCIDEMEGALHSAGPDFMNDVYNEMAWGKVLSLLEADHPETVHPVVVPMPEPAPAPRKRSPAVFMAAASILILISVGLFLLVSSQKQASTSAAKPMLAAASGIRLLLDNGDTIALPENSREEIAAAQAKLHPVPGQLTFTPTGSASGWNTLMVPTGKDYKVVLADGSQIHLNAFSKLRFPFSFNGDTREVYLEGEAYFDIAPDAKHPFIVHAGKVSTRVLGTAFNVSAYNDSMIVTSLVQGSVRTAPADQAAVTLKPGMETVYSPGHTQVVQAFDESVTLGWRKGEYTYYNQSLASLDQVLRHWYGKSLVFTDNDLPGRKLTGVIERDQPVAEFLESLKKSSGIAYHITDDKIYLSPR